MDNLFLNTNSFKTWSLSRLLGNSKMFARSIHQSKILGTKIIGWARLLPSLLAGECPAASMRSNQADCVPPPSATRTIRPDCVTNARKPIRIRRGEPAEKFMLRATVAFRQHDVVIIGNKEPAAVNRLRPTTAGDERHFVQEFNE